LSDVDSIRALLRVNGSRPGAAAAARARGSGAIAPV